jgi:prevent-host-death family protein
MRNGEPRTQIMNASAARDQWGQVLQQVYQKQARVLVEKSGVPMAAIVSADDLEQLRRIEAEETNALARMRAAFAGKSDDELMAEVAQVIDEVRQEQRRQRDG